MSIILAGAEDLKETLLAMEEGAGEAVLIPAVAASAADLTAVMAALAPRRTGRLARGIGFKYHKSGRGFCKFNVELDAEVYYGLFQEFGLGDKSGRGPSARTQRRRANYDAMTELQRRGYTSGSVGLTKKQQKGLAAMEKGNTVQGKRRPNMAPQPFIRPAIFPNRERFMNQIIDGIAAGVEAASGVDIGGGA